MATARSSKPAPRRAAPKKGSHAAPSLWERHERDIWIVLLFVIGLFTLLAEVGTLGPVGKVIATALEVALGVARFAVTVMLLGLLALPYFLAMASDLRYCGYKRLDVHRIYGFNLVLLPVNLAGTMSSIVQGITASKAAFANLPPEVQADVVKREGEVNQGLAKLAEYKGLEPLAELSRQNGTTLVNAVNQYRQLEKHLL